MFLLIFTPDVGRSPLFTTYSYVARYSWWQEKAVAGCLASHEAENEQGLRWDYKPQGLSPEAHFL